MPSHSLKAVPEPKAKRSDEWPRFATKLAEALAALEEDQYLILNVKRSNRFIQFAAQGAFGMRIETTSNSYLPKDEKLDPRQISALMAAGWTVPTGAPEEATHDLDPDGSPNFFMEVSAPFSCEAVAQMTVRTLVEVLHVPHPASLEYEAADLEGGVIKLPSLGLRLAKRKSPSRDQKSLPQRLLDALKEVTGNDQVQFDSDGDVGIRHGSAVILVRIIEEPLCVRIFSPVLREVEENPDIVGRLNDINAREILTRFVFVNGSIFAAAEISAAPFVAEHLAQAMDHFCSVVDSLDSLLQAEFGGHLAFAETMLSLAKH